MFHGLTWVIRIDCDAVFAANRPTPGRVPRSSTFRSEWRSGRTRTTGDLICLPTYLLFEVLSSGVLPLIRNGKGGLPTASSQSPNWGYFSGVLVSLSTARAAGQPLALHQSFLFVQGGDLFQQGGYASTRLQGRIYRGMPFSVRVHYQDPCSLVRLLDHVR